MSAHIGGLCYATNARTGVRAGPARRRQGVELVEEQHAGARSPGPGEDLADLRPDCNESISQHTQAAQQTSCCTGLRCSTGL